MISNVKVHILRGFVNENKKYGNPVGIIVDEKNSIAVDDRQTIAANLGFSETVFINNLLKGDISIFNPIDEVEFAGHALVGASYFINRILNKPVNHLNCKGSQVRTWQENNLTWISASLTNTPPWNNKQLKNAHVVDNLSIVEAPKEHTIVWAWIDQDKGIIRARTFAPDWGIPEDEANGSGSMQLAAKLARNLEIHHGKGSVIYTKPLRIGIVSVGGRVVDLNPKVI